MTEETRAREGSLILDESAFEPIVELFGPAKARRLMEGLAAQLQGSFAERPDSPEARERTAREAHAMVSAAGTLGLLAFSEACKRLEHAPADAFGTELAAVRRLRDLSLEALRDRLGQL